MCGIAGIVRLKAPYEISEERMDTMLLKLQHRGPDDRGVVLNARVGLGFVRLSILDLSSQGHQPMEDASGRYVIVFNGEIYNYIELREELEQQGIFFRTQTDTEVLLSCYIHYGSDFLEKLNGMFAFAIYDRELRSCFCARDRYGVKPFYYYDSGEEIIFASEISSILAVYGLDNRPNFESIYDYLAYNRTDQTDATFFEGIKKLQHGCSMRIDGNGMSIARWYDLKERVSSVNEVASVSSYRTLLEDAIRIRLRSDVPLGVCLSGGLDSSTIVSMLLKRLNVTDLSTFSAVYSKEEKADESDFIDIYRDSVADMHFITPDVKSLCSDLHTFIECHGEPLPSAGPYAQYCVMRLAHPTVKVTLDGQGADEELCGYHYFYGLFFKTLLYNGRYKELFHEMSCYWRVHRSLYGFKSTLFFMLSGRLQRFLRSHYHGVMSDTFLSTYGKRSVIVDELYASKSVQEALLNHFEYKLEHLLKWNDRNAMHFSIESRTPFLDYRLVEYTLSLGESWLIKDGYTKSILRESMKGILPEPIRMRRDKKGFSNPLSRWLRDERFKKEVLELLQSESFAKRGIINVSKAIKVFELHQRGRIDASKDIWKWVNLELWFRLYIDKN